MYLNIRGSLLNKMIRIGLGLKYSKPFLPVICVVQFLLFPVRLGLRIDVLYLTSNPVIIREDSFLC